MARNDEDDLLAPYALALAEEAYDALARRYGIEPPTPIRLEMYPSHADFSVRTIGLAGMGALGVCFGKVIAQDSPRARPRGHFNWGSTLWHELAHTFTLAVSEHRVPRWLTEGLSVLEERRARPGWGDDLSPLFLAAWRDGELLPVGELNNGFVRPNSPEQIGLSYYQASLVVELIERDWGKETILGMLRGYRDHQSTEEILRGQLGIELATFDQRFEAFLEESFGGAKRALGPAEATSEEGGGEGSIELPDAGRPRSRGAEAARQLPGAAVVGDPPGGRGAAARRRALPGACPRSLSAVRRARQSVSIRWRRSIAIAATTTTRRGSCASTSPSTRPTTRRGWSWLPSNRSWEIEPPPCGRSRRRSTSSRSTPSSTAVWPISTRRAATPPGLVRARAALVALQPTDMAQALYDLAEAQLAAGQPQEARRQVLRALEIAPSFEAAQRLLLKLHGGAADPGAKEQP